MSKIELITAEPILKIEKIEVSCSPKPLPNYSRDFGFCQ
jgi:hypothetical protein